MAMAALSFIMASFASGSLTHSIITSKTFPIFWYLRSRSLASSMIAWTRFTSEWEASLVDEYAELILQAYTDLPESRSQKAAECKEHIHVQKKYIKDMYVEDKFSHNMRKILFINKRKM